MDNQEKKIEKNPRKLTLVEWMCKHKVSSMRMPLPMAIAKAIDYQE
jgi:hypothetical protein